MKKALIGNAWDDILSPVFASEGYATLRTFLKAEYTTRTIYPAMEDIFTALRLTPPGDVRVVVLGQDPYINPGQAHGLAFSVLNGQPPPSLLNIYKEINADLGVTASGTGCLTGWAKQGVLLLNAVLTVAAGASNSHKNQGWEPLTDAVVAHLGAQPTPTVFLLWGRNAQAKRPLITHPAHLVLTAPHPSPLSAYAGFFGCGHFSKTNAFLKENGLAEIDWTA